MKLVCDTVGLKSSMDTTIQEVMEVKQKNLAAIPINLGTVSHNWKLQSFSCGGKWVCTVR